MHPWIIFFFIKIKIWISVLVIHSIPCNCCGKDEFTGFRYKCQRCVNYNMCQDCFWQGKTSGAHSPEHQVKEYTSFVSNKKNFFF